MDKCTERVRARDARGDDVKATTIKEKEKEKKIYVYYIWRYSQAKILSKSLHKPRWCARPRPGDAGSAPITIFACSLLHYKIQPQTMLLLGP